MGAPSREIGKKGEELVAAYLEQQGFIVIQRNFSLRRGEIDLIAQKNELLVFVEVKLRRKLYVSINELIPHSKRHKIIQTALFFLSRYPHEDKVIRFDVALVESIQNDYTISYFEQAFTAEGYWP